MSIYDTSGDHRRPRKAVWVVYRRGMVEVRILSGIRAKRNAGSDNISCMREIGELFVNVA